MRFVVALLMLLASMQLTSIAFAQPEGSPPPSGEDDNVSDADKERARILFDEGRQLLADGNIAAACDKFKQSNKVRPGIGTMYNLADCSEKLGRTATAYTLFLDVAERTKAALQTDREQKARERIAAIEPKLMKIRLSVARGGRVQSITLDGEVVSPDNYNKPIAADPGEHVVVAKTFNDNGEPFEETVDLDQPGKTVTVAIPVAPGAKMKRRVGMIVGGAIVAAVGIASVIGCAFVATNDGDPALIAGLGILGVAGLAVGIPIFAVGFKKKPVRSAEVEVPLAPSPVPQVAIGPTGGSLTWSF